MSDGSIVAIFTALATIGAIWQATGGLEAATTRMLVWYSPRRRRSWRVVGQVIRLGCAGIVAGLWAMAVMTGFWGSVLGTAIAAALLVVAAVLVIAAAVRWGDAAAQPGAER